GRYLATGSADCTVKVWDARTGKLVLPPLGPYGGRIQCVAFSHDSRRLAFCGMDQTATVYGLEGGKEITTFRGHTDQVNGLALSPDGRRVASASNDATIRVWGADSGTEIATLRGHTRWVTAVAFSPDGRRLASAGADGTVKLWEAPGPDPRPGGITAPG